MFSASQNNEDESDYDHMTIELFYQQKDCEEQVNTNAKVNTNQIVRNRSLMK